MPDPVEMTTPYNPNDPSSGEQNPFIAAMADGGAPADLAPTQAQLDTSGVGPSWIPPWATQPTGAPMPAPYAPTPSATAAIDQAAQQLPSPMPPPAPYAGSIGAPANAPYVPPGLAPSTTIQAPPLDRGAANLGQPTVPPAVPDQLPPGQRLVPMLDVDKMRALGTALDPTASPDDRAKAWSSLPPNVRTETLLHAQGDQLGKLGDIYESLTPDEKATWQVVQGNAEAMQSNARVVQASRDYQAAVEANHRWEIDQRAQIQAKMDASAQRAQELAQTEIKPRWSAGKLIGAIIGGALGGLASPSTGGRNLFLESFNKAMDQDLANQRENLANKWRGVNNTDSLLAQEYARTGDIAQAEFTYRQTAYNAALNTIKTEAQQYVPGGTTFAKLAATHDQVIAQMQQNAVAYQQKQNMDAATLAKTRGEAANQAFDAELKQQKLLKERAAATAGPVPRRTFSKDQLIAAGFSPDIVAALPATGLSTTRPDLQHVTDADIKGGLEQNSLAAEVGSKQAELAGKRTANEAEEAKSTASAPVQTGVSDDGQPIIQTQKMVNADGNVWRVPEKFQTMLGSATSVNRLADKLTREIQQWGGQSDLAKSSHWQDMKSDYQDLVFALHGTKGIEGFRPGTSELLHELTGGVDPTSFIRDATSGIQNMKRNINADLNDVATAGNYTGKPITFLDTSKPPAPKLDDVGAAEQAAMAKDPNDSPADREFGIRAAYRHDDSHQDDLVQTSIDQQLSPRTPEMIRALKLRMPPSKVAAVDSLLTAIRNPAAKPAMTAASPDAQTQIVKAAQAEVTDATAAIATAKKAGDQKAVYAAEDQLSTAKQKLSAMQAAIRAQASLGTLSTDAPDQPTRDYAQRQLQAVTGEEIP